MMNYIVFNLFWKLFTCCLSDISLSMKWDVVVALVDDCIRHFLFQKHFV